MTTDQPTSEAHELASRRFARPPTDKPEPPDPADLTATQRERRDRIVDAAYRLLEHHDHELIQVRDVADHASVALGTVYRYFGSKEHLFAWVLVRWEDRLRERMTANPPRGGTVEEQILDIYGRIIAGFARHPQFFRLFMAMHTTSDRHARGTFLTFTTNARLSMSGPLQQLGPDLADDIGQVLMATLQTALNGWANGEVDVDTVHHRVRRAVELIFSPPPAGPGATT